MLENGQGGPSIGTILNGWGRLRSRCQCESKSAPPPTATEIVDAAPFSWSRGDTSPRRSARALAMRPHDRAPRAFIESGGGICNSHWGLCIGKSGASVERERVQNFGWAASQLHESRHECHSAESHLPRSLPQLLPFFPQRSKPDHRRLLAVCFLFCHPP